MACEYYFENFMLEQEFQLKDGASKPLLIKMSSMLAGGGLIEHEMKALHYFFENFMHKRKHELVDGASKPFLINNKDLTLCSMLAGGGLI